MKIAFVGDLHGDFAALNNLDVDVILQVGDMGIFPDPEKADYQTRKRGEHAAFEPYYNGSLEFHTPIYTVRGNHDDQDFIHNALHGSELVPNLHILKDGYLHILRPEPIAIFGFGGIFAPLTWNMKWHERPVKRKNHFGLEEYEEAMIAISHFDIAKALRPNWVKKTIFISHDAPLHYNGSRGTVNILSLIQALKPDIARFGHYHYDLTLNVVGCDDTKIIGYRKVEIIEI